MAKTFFKMITQTIMLRKLKYSEEWINLGIVDSNAIYEQFKLLDKNPHSEHHRFNSLLKFLDKKEGFSENELKSIIQLISFENDFKGDIYIYLLESNKLSKDQFEIVSKLFEEEGKWALAKLSRIKLKKDLKSNSLLLGEITELIRLQDSKIQNVILDNSISNNNILSLLINNSKFKKIINRAQNIYNKNINFRKS